MENCCVSWIHFKMSHGCWITLMKTLLTGVTGQRLTSLTSEHKRPYDYL